MEVEEIGQGIGTQDFGVLAQRGGGIVLAGAIAPLVAGLPVRTAAGHRLAGPMMGPTGGSVPLPSSGLSRRMHPDK